MNQLNSPSDGRTVRNFLEKPYARKRLDHFFKLTERLTRSYLFYLSKSGWRMPSDLYAGDNPISDITIDILGSFFSSKKNRPFHVIFDYFHSEAGRFALPESDDELLGFFKALLFGFIRQELSKLTGERNPPIARLKRRFRDTMQSPQYEILARDGRPDVLAFAAKYRGVLRLDLPMIPDDTLLRIVEEAYLKTGSRSEWCRQIFELIAEDSRYCNCVEKHRLISATVAVNLRQVDVDGLFPSSLPSPEDEHVFRAIAKAHEESLTWAGDNVIRLFITKGRIGKEDSIRLLDSLRLYLTDFAWHGEADKLPVYFRQTMPEEARGRYQKDYKYIFDTIVAKTTEDFRNRLRKELQ